MRSLECLCTLCGVEQLHSHTHTHASLLITFEFIRRVYVFIFIISMVPLSAFIHQYSYSYIRIIIFVFFLYFFRCYFMMVECGRWAWVQQHQLPNKCLLCSFSHLSLNLSLPERNVVEADDVWRAHHALHSEAMLTHGMTDPAQMEMRFTITRPKMDNATDGRWAIRVPTIDAHLSDTGCATSRLSPTRDTSRSTCTSVEWLEMTRCFY